MKTITLGYNEYQNIEEQLKRLKAFEEATDIIYYRGTTDRVYYAIQPQKDDRIPLSGVVSHLIEELSELRQKNEMLVKEFTRELDNWRDIYNNGGIPSTMYGECVVRMNRQSHTIRVWNDTLKKWELK